jgi:hypothetical protein
VPFRADVCDHHAAPVWLRAGDWEAARHAVERIVSWRRIPAPLAWMAEARYRADGLESVWPLLTELAWLSAGRFAALSQRARPMALTPTRRRAGVRFIVCFPCGHPDICGTSSSTLVRLFPPSIVWQDGTWAGLDGQFGDCGRT